MQNYNSVGQTVFDTTIVKSKNKAAAREKTSVTENIYALSFVLLWRAESYPRK